VKRFADAMPMFGTESLAGLGSALFCLYQQNPSDLSDPPSLAGADPIRWLAILAAIASATCFIGALNMGRVADS